MYVKLNAKWSPGNILHSSGGDGVVAPLEGAANVTFHYFIYTRTRVAHYILTRGSGSGALCALRARVLATPPAVFLPRYSPQCVCVRVHIMYGRRTQND